MRGEFGSSQALRAVEKPAQDMAMSKDDDVHINLDTFKNLVQESNEDEPEEVCVKRKPKRKLHEEQASLLPRLAIQGE